MQVHPMAQSVLFNLGIVTVSVTLLDVLWRLAGGDPLQARFAELSEQVDRLSRTVDVMGVRRESAYAKFTIALATTARSKSG